MTTPHDTSSTTKCPCCDNPWSRATSDFFAKMCVECQEKTENNDEDKDKDTSVFGLDRRNLDPTMSPQDNFFQYANGGWMKRNPIPPGYPSWNTFVSLHVQSQEQCKTLLEDLQAKQEQQQQSNAESKEDPLSENEAKLAAYYHAAMDEDTIEQAGISPLKPVLQLIDDIVKARESNDTVQYATLLGSMAAQFGIFSFFKTSASPDAKDSNHTLCNLSQGGLGLPDKDYYFDEDKTDKREAYRKHISNMLKLLQQASSGTTGDTESLTVEEEEEGKIVFDVELKLAEAHMTRTECRDPEATYNKMTLASLMEKSKHAFDFVAYLKGSTKKSPEELGEINVRNVEALLRAAQVLNDIDPHVLKQYLTWHTLHSCAPYLNKAFVNENFDFFERIMTGTQEIKPRWKRAMTFVESALGEALGQLYCQAYFDQTCKTRAVAIVEAVRQALEERLKEVDWMTSEETREEALKKMGRFRVKIGYPNRWIDYDPLKIGMGEGLLEGTFKASEFAHKREVKEMNAPTDREKWFLTPQTVNAYYHPFLNEIVFPAAILQHPFFDKTADDSVNFGAMGAVVGHEMTHAFDDKGRKFNYAGILHDWWSPEDAAEYEQRVQVMVDQANAFQVHGKNVQGKLTSGENIADLGGLRLSLRALQNKQKSEQEEGKSDLVDGFTPVQRFFLAWAQCWRQNITEERSLQLLTIDPHGPNEMRCNGPLANMEEFHRAFDVSDGAPMFKQKETRVDIW